MMKIFLFVLFVIIGIATVGFFLSKTKSDPKVLSSAIVNKIQTNANQGLAQTKNNLLTVVKKTVDNVDNTLDNSLANSNNGSVKINVVQKNNSVDSLEPTTINFSSSQNLELNLKKNQKYLLKFQNLPANFCLYVNSSQVVVNNDNLVELLFADSGHYPLKMDFCNPSAKILGQITVE